MASSSIASEDPTYQETLRLLEKYEILQKRQATLDEEFPPSAEDNYQDDDDKEEGGDQGEDESGSDFGTDTDLPLEDRVISSEPIAVVVKTSSDLQEPQKYPRLETLQFQSQDSIIDEPLESREQRTYVYINTIPIIGAIYGAGRLIVKYRQREWDEVKQTKWRIIKNLLTSFTLAASALLVPLRKREVVYAAVATGFLEGIIDTLVDYYLLTKEERMETSTEELIFNVMCHTPILGLFYNVTRLFISICRRNLEMIKATLWGLVINFITTTVTLFTVIQFSLKATGSLPITSATRVSVFSKSAQIKVAEAFVEKGTTAPLIKAGKSLAAKKGRRLNRKIKRELRELRQKIDKSMENLKVEHPKLRRRLRRLLES